MFTWIMVRHVMMKSCQVMARHYITCQDMLKLALNVASKLHDLPCHAKRQASHAKSWHDMPYFFLGQRQNEVVGGQREARQCVCQEDQQTCDTG